ncbi:mediator of RNA polymerase II transcription subunit 8 [Alligator mississippiensis]|uniref:Mediator of RNA polymerase II transcription subunit 8 n=2 Tax=Crocodylia TaxID=1294634 RepID=A0A151N0G4_ALLMI|nr:mediator of RNA polymerase II transcription subunit 8 [Alligator mississippiensis]
MVAQSADLAQPLLKNLQLVVPMTEVPCVHQWMVLANITHIGDPPGFCQLVDFPLDLITWTLTWPKFWNLLLGFALDLREEKQLEVTLEALISQVADLKNSLVSFIYKLENEYDRLTWPSVLDSFALLSGQLNTLNKVLKHEKTPLLRNQVIIPLVLSPDRDEEIMRQTEGRVPVFSHEVVPDHLRTKPDPEVEEQEKQLITDAARISPDVAQKQIQSLNKMCSNLLEKISKEERESESGGLRQNKQTFNPTDTNALVAAVAFGKGLSNRRPPGSGGPVQSGQPGTGPIIAGASGMQQVQISGAPTPQQPMLAGVQMSQASQPGKMPSGIKTNIKSASMHPYQR